MIELKDIYIAYDKILIDHQSLVIPDQQITLIQGLSGSGKTTLLYEIGLLHQKFYSHYYYDNCEINDYNDMQKSEIRFRDISFIFQNNILYSYYTVKELFEHYAYLYHMTLALQDIKVLLEMVNLDVPLSQSIKTLSVGEKQRLSLACALIKKPRLLILDEPTSALDKQNRLSYYQLLRTLCKQYQITIVLTNHDPEAIEYADMVYEIKDTHLILKKQGHEIEKGKYKQLKRYVPKKITHKFYFNYFKKYYKSQILFQMVILIVLILAVFSSLIIQNFIMQNFNEQLIEIENQSQNQIMVSTENNQQFKECVKIFQDKDYVEIHNVYDLFIDIDGKEIPVFPMYNTSFIDHQILKRYAYQDGVYVNYTFLHAHEDYYIKKNYKLYSYNESGERYFSKHEYSIVAQLKSEVQSGYNDVINFVYLDSQLYQMIVDELHISAIPNRQLVCFRNFTDMVKIIDDLKKYDVIVNDGYQDMSLLLNIFHQIQFSLYFQQFLLFLIMLIFIILFQYLYFRKIHSSLTLLYSEGFCKLHLLKVFITDHLLKIVAVFLIFFIITFLYNMTALSMYYYVFLILLLILLPIAESTLLISCFKIDKL